MSLKCQAIDCGIIREFHKKFACTLNFKCFDWKELFQHLSQLDFESCELHLHTLLNLTVDNNLFKKYPFRKSYLHFFVKNLLKEGENYDISNTRVYETYVNLLKNSSEDSEEYYKHFLFKNTCITLKENKNFIYAGTTGLCTWEGGVALSNWCLHKSELLTGSNILELGSGSGLTGLVLLSQPNLAIKNYTFTDCHELVLDQLKFNINLNLQEGTDFPIVCNNQTFVNVINFNWEDDGNKCSKLRPKPDVILAADVVFDYRLLPSLVQTISYFLDSAEKFAVVACTVRNQETLDAFFQYIRVKNLQIELDPSQYPVELERNTSSQVNIYIVKKKTIHKKNSEFT